MKVKCAFCKTYVQREEAYRNGLQSFCSEQHYRDLHFSRQQKSAYKSLKRSTDSLSSDEKKKIIESDGFQCRFCGRQSGLHVHHAKYRSEGGSNDPSNLITLCNDHHGLVHSNKKRYQPLCLKIIEIRESYSIKNLSILSLEKMMETGALQKFIDSRV